MDYKERAELNRRDMGRWLRVFRMNSNYSLADVQVLINGIITAQGISKIELGESKPSFEVIVRLSRVYGIPLLFFEQFIAEDRVVNQ